jgi:adenosylcobyric acid synthase
VADIDRGGVFATLVGTLELLEPEERALVKAFVINKFRGDLSLLEPGLDWLEKKTGVPVAGVIPYYHDIHIAEEDSVPLEHRRLLKAKDSYLLDIAVIGLPHISNFDDFDPLEQEHGIRLRYVEANDGLGTPDLIIIPGTKSTVADLEYLRRVGFADEIIALAKSGVPVIGICGGYQMLGKVIEDPEHIESAKSWVEGLGLLPVTTFFLPTKSTHQVKGSIGSVPGLLRNAHGLPITGYEIHMGQTTGGHLTAPFLVTERSRKPCEDLDGCCDMDGNVLGTYIHGLFHNQEFRRCLLSELAVRKGIELGSWGKVLSKEEEYNQLADLVRSSLDMDLIYQTIGP